LTRCIGWKSRFKSLVHGRATPNFTVPFTIYYQFIKSWTIVHPSKSLVLLGTSGFCAPCGNQKSLAWPANDHAIINCHCHTDLIRFPSGP
jgi:hypothetical protein